MGFADTLKELFKTVEEPRTQTSALGLVSQSRFLNIQARIRLYDDREAHRSLGR